MNTNFVSSVLAFFCDNQLPLVLPGVIRTLQMHHPVDSKC